jgi:hypothetical protein
MKIRVHDPEFWVALAIGAGAFVFAYTYSSPRIEAQAGKPIYCTASAFYDASDSGNIQVVPAPSQSSGAIYICSYALMAGTNAVNVGLTYGTGTNCGTGNTKVTPAWQLAANGGIVEPIANFNGLYLPIQKALCVTSSAGQAHQARISYAVIF